MVRFSFEEPRYIGDAARRYGRELGLFPVWGEHAVLWGEGDSREYLTPRDTSETHTSFSPCGVESKNRKRFRFRIKSISARRSAHRFAWYSADSPFRFVFGKQICLKNHG